MSPPTGSSSARSIRCCKLSDAGRAVFITSALATLARPYFGSYAVSKAALDIMVRTYAAENASTKVRANLFSPGQTRTRMMATAFPGIDPMTLPTPEEVAQNDRAAVPAGMHGERQAVRIPQRKVSGIPRAGLGRTLIN